MQARQTSRSTPQSLVVVTYACGHGERVPLDRVTEVRGQAQSGAACTRCCEVAASQATR